MAPSPCQMEGAWWWQSANGFVRASTRRRWPIQAESHSRCAILQKASFAEKGFYWDSVLFQMGHYVPASEMGLGHFFSGKSGQQSHHKCLFNRYAYDRVHDVCTSTSRQGEKNNVFYNTVSFEWHHLAAGCCGQCHRRPHDALLQSQLHRFAQHLPKPTVVNLLQSVLRRLGPDSA